MDNIRRGNKQLIKELNRAIVINTILNYGPVSRTRISEITFLGLSTVSNIEIKIVSLQSGEKGWIIGAAELVLSEVFKTPIFKSKGKEAVQSAFHW